MTVTTLTPLDLHCEQRCCPLGIDEPLPLLGWALAGGGRHARQSAWQVQVGSRPDAADAWDSGRIADDRQAGIAYAGSALASRTRYHWRVRVWDEAGNAGTWSAAAWFETAFLSPGEFTAPWLGGSTAGDADRCELASARWIWADAQAAQGAAMMLFRTVFTLPAEAVVRRARLIHMAQSAWGPWAQRRSYLRVNGVSRPHWNFIAPPRAGSEWDITAEVGPGDNRLAMRCWLRSDAAFIALVAVELADGRQLEFPTGVHPWLVRPQADESDPPDWDDPADPGWQPAMERGAFGAGPWPADDIRNLADKLVPPVQLRRGFDVAKAIRSARIYATACGVYELALNGRRVDERWLAPGWTNYDQRLHYQTYDVTGLLHTGANQLLATVADGWFSGETHIGHHVWGTEKALKLQLHLSYADGTEEVITSAPAGWQAGTGPLRHAELFHGQHEDRTRDTVWRAAVALSPVHGRLLAQPDEPVRVRAELPVRTLVERRPGVCIADFGQNLAGVVRLRIRAPRGTRLTLRFAEVLDRHGELWTENLRQARATDLFTCAGDGEEVFEPRFTFHGFRYCEVAGLPGGLLPEQLTALAIASDLSDRGAFSCGDPLLMRLHENIRWSWRGNTISVPTDCPQRDERMGWTGDAQIFVATACRLTAAGPFFAKYLDDVLDLQAASGALPDMAPGRNCPPVAHFGWADAGVIIPWTLWRTQGDTRVIARHWTAMRRYLDHRDARAVDDLNTDGGFGDWVSPAPQTPNEVLGPIYHAWVHRLMAEMAEGIGLASDAAHHRARFAAIAAAWQGAHLATDGRISSDTQCAYVCALRAGIIPAALHAAVGGHLVATIERAGWHLHTGFLGTGNLLPAISAAGHDAVAWRVLMQESAPGWLYTVRNGATTMWERWNSYSPETGPVNIDHMNSYNHYAFGAVGEWMHSTILGLGQADGDVGWQRLRIRPVPGGGCRHASGSHRSLRGETRVAWHIADDRFHLSVALPPNCRAEVHVPARAGSSIAHDGAVQTGPGVFAIGAGDWRFSAPL